MRNESIKTALGGKIKFHEDLDRLEKETLVGAKFVLRDATVVGDWDSEYGTTSFALLMVQLPDTGKCYTTLCGGIAIVRQVQKLLKKGKLPGHIDCVLNKVLSGNDREYYVLDWPDNYEPIVIGKPEEVVPVDEKKPEEVPVVDKKPEELFPEEKKEEIPAV